MGGWLWLPDVVPEITIFALEIAKKRVPKPQNFRLRRSNMRIKEFLQLIMTEIVYCRISTINNDGDCLL